MHLLSQEYRKLNLYINLYYFPVDGAHFIAQATQAPATEGGQVIKVMNPADVHAVTVKSVMSRDGQLGEMSRDILL